MGTAWKLWRKKYTFFTKWKILKNEKYRIIILYIINNYYIGHESVLSWTKSIAIWKVLLYDKIVVKCRWEKRYTFPTKTETPESVEKQTLLHSFFYSFTVGISTSMASDFYYTGNASNGMLVHMIVLFFVTYPLFVSHTKEAAWFVERNDFWKCYKGEKTWKNAKSLLAFCLWSCSCLFLQV